MDLNDGNYPYTITYSGDDKYSSFAKSNTFKVDNILPTNISAPIVSTVYNGNKYLTITLNSHLKTDLATIRPITEQESLHLLRLQILTMLKHPARLNT